VKRESYLMIDNRCSGGGVMEAATFTCSHCQRVVVMNPDRTRERGYCRKCDHLICDECVQTMFETLTCVPIAKVFDELQEGALRGQALIQVR
jgi:hypothetical protein